MEKSQTRSGWWYLKRLAAVATVAMLFVALYSPSHSQVGIGEARTEDGPIIGRDNNGTINTNTDRRTYEKTYERHDNRKIDQGENNQRNVHTDGPNSPAILDTNGDVSIHYGK